MRTPLRPALRPVMRGITEGRRGISSGGGSEAGVYQVLIYGQSLSLGSDPVSNGSVISDPTPAHYMFNGGVRAHYDNSPALANPNTPINSANLSSLVELDESLSAAGASYGETFASGIAAQSAGKLLLSTTGRAAYSVAPLSRDGAGVFGDLNHYQNTYACALHGRLAADALETPYSVGPVIFKQGEADGAASTTKATWKAKVQALRDDFAKDLSAATLTDTSTLKMVVDQQAFVQVPKTFEEIAVGAIELHRAGNGVVCAGPTYPEQFAAINDVHMTSLGYRRYGERLGRVVEKIRTGGEWNPCHITSASRSGTTITVNVHVPVPPLVLDTTLVTTVANSGFTYSGASITGVAITDSSAGTIEITLGAAAAGTLGYAYANGIDQRLGPVHGARGNIRDSESAVTIHDGAALHNWLCNDSWVVA